MRTSVFLNSNFYCLKVIIYCHSVSTRNWQGNFCGMWCYYIASFTRSLYLLEWACEKLSGEWFVLEMLSLFKLIGFIFNSCKQSYVKWNHSQVVFQLDFVFIFRVFVGFWFTGSVSWLVSVWCMFFQGAF